MQCILAPDWESGVQALAERLEQELQAGAPVLWLLSGGSNVAASVQVLERLPAALTGNLGISLADERYGPPGHPDSNWTKLLQAGLAPQAAKLLPVLQSGLDLEATRAKYESLLQQAFQAGTRVIVQLGIGDDGHVAGLLPGSPGTGQGAALAVAYASHPFHRVSISFAGLRQATAVYAFAFGPGKKPAMEQLAHSTVSVTEQPAQILKQLHEAYVYNDQVGEGRV